MGLVLLFFRAAASTAIGICLFGALVLGVLFDVVHRDLLQADFYTRHLAANRLYDRIHTDVLPAVNATRLFYGDLQVNEEDALQLARQAFPPQFVQRETERVIEGFLPWMRGETERLNVTLSLASAKLDARTATLRYVGDRLNRAPPCRPDQEFDPSAATNGSFPECLPAGPMGEEARQEYLAALTIAIDDALERAPDSLDLVAVGAMESGLSRADFLDRVQRLRTVVAYGDTLGGALTVGVIAGFALLMAVVHLPRPRASVMWVGITLAASGAVILIVTLLARELLPPWVDAIVGAQPELYPRAVGLVTDVTRSAFYELAADMARPAAITFALGLLLLGVSFLLPQRVSRPSMEQLLFKRLRLHLKQSDRD